MAGESRRRCDGVAPTGFHGLCNDPANWNAAPPNAENQPVILQHPRSRIAYLGETVLFEVSVIGDAPLGYQWFSNNIPLSGQTSSSLELTGIQPDYAAEYSVAVTNSWVRC